MTTSGSSTVQKLTLVVLVGILGCLIVIIAQHRTPTPPSDSVSDVAEDAAPAEPAIAEPVPIPTGVTPEPSRSPIHLAVPARSITNLGRANLSRPQPQLLTAAAPLTDLPPPDLTSLVPEPVEVATPALIAPAVAVPQGTSSLTGRARWIGGAPPEITIDMGRPCSQEHAGPVTTRHYLVSPDGGLANVVVFVESGLENRRYAANREAASLNITGCLFEPYVFCLMPGQPLKIRNLDFMLHNMHVTAQSNPEFNFAMARQGQVSQRTFRTPEMFIRMRCDVHPWEFAYASVMANPFFAITDKDGIFQLPPGLPAGKYVLAAAHLKAGKIRRTITYNPSRSEPIDFEFKQL